MGEIIAIEVAPFLHTDKRTVIPVAVFQIRHLKPTCKEPVVNK